MRWGMIALIAVLAATAGTASARGRTYTENLGGRPAVALVYEHDATVVLRTYSTRVVVCNLGDGYLMAGEAGNPHWPVDPKSCVTVDSNSRNFVVQAGDSGDKQLRFSVGYTPPGP